MTKLSSASGVTFRPLDDLFEPTDGSSDKPQLAELDVESLIPFKDHPFREYPEEKMQEMVESVTEHGILMPILSRAFIHAHSGLFGRQRRHKIHLRLCKSAEA